MAASPNIEKIKPPALPSATRWKINRNWSYRGDNTKYRDKK
jgi:hypothetical protein